MYLPAIADHPLVELVGVSGRDADRAAVFAQRWSIPASFVNHVEMFESTKPDAVIIATSNDSHVELATGALAAGAHVLCEKPLGRSATEAQQIAAAARAADAITLTPFTYAEMPTNRFVKRLVDEGYLGRPHHVNMRYFTDFSLDGEYAWRFDKPISGAGIIGDIGSHFLYLAHWWFGEIVSVAATTRTFIDHGPRPDGSPIDPVNDSAVLTVEFANGAYGSIHVSAVCWEGTPFGQIHEFDLHGDAGTLHSVNDWDTIQEVKGVKRGEPGPAKPLPLPADLSAGIRFDSAHNTYRDVFRATPAMTRGWIDAIAAGHKIQPDFSAGARIAEFVDAAIDSSEQGGRAIPV